MGRELRLHRMYRWKGDVRRLIRTSPDSPAKAALLDVLATTAQPVIRAFHSMSLLSSRSLGLVAILASGGMPLARKLTDPHPSPDLVRDLIAALCRVMQHEVRCAFVSTSFENCDPLPSIRNDHVPAAGLLRRRPL